MTSFPFFGIKEHKKHRLEATMIRYILFFLPLASAFSPLEISVAYNGDFKVITPDNAEGIKRYISSELLKEGRVIWQYFYFCEKANSINKKKCGYWVDDKNVKIEGANNNVKRVGDGAVISKMTKNDAGVYSKHPEDKNKKSPFAGLITVLVNGPPSDE
uniref:Uncharacterized protein n=1 Tax=Caenorhabditis japonica TaxID=281687 RepID=A0A8R1HWZ4_CAEJA